MCWILSQKKSDLMQRESKILFLFLNAGCLDSRHNVSTSLKNLKLQRWFSELRATHSWKLYLWAKGQLGMRFTLIWSHARVPQSHLFSFIANKQKGNTESELKCSCSEVLLRCVLTCRAAWWQQESLGILKQPSRTWLWKEGCLLVEPNPHPFAHHPAGIAKGAWEGLGRLWKQDHILMLARTPVFVLMALQVDKTHF